MERPTIEQPIFQEDWWLDAAAPGRWQRVVAESGSAARAHLKVYRTRKLGLPALLMPPLTRTLGPVFEQLSGKPETVRRMKVHLTGELIRQFPPHIIFNHVLEPWESDGFAWRLHGYAVNVEYTFRIEDCSDLDHIFAGVRDTTRRVIRRSEEKLTVDANGMTIPQFLQFYFANLKMRNERPHFGGEIATRVLIAAAAHDACTILCARLPNGEPVAGICIVFDRRNMYYLMTTHNPQSKETGAVALLVWKAICLAAEYDLAFDFDGFGDRGTAQFVSQFGGVLRQRLRVSRIPKLVQALAHLGPRFTNDAWFDRPFI